MKLLSFRLFALFFVFAGVLAVAAPAPAPIVLTGVDRRAAISLDGEWASIVDPYFSGLMSFHHEEKKNGWFLNQKAKPGDPFPIEYNFSKAPKLKVPADWNTQRESLFFYEGPVWYERDFTYQPKEHTRVFLHVGAANYKSWFWVNGQKVCEHEGGFTSFNCEVTAAVHAGANFVVAAVDNTRHEDGVPTLETDWWNYGGITRSVSLIEVPEAFIDQYDVHLFPSRERKLARQGNDLGAVGLSHLAHIHGWIHVDGGHVGDKVEIQIPELKSTGSGVLGADGRAQVLLVASEIERWSPETPKLYNVILRAGEDSIEEKIGFRTIETSGTQTCLSPRRRHSCRGALSHGACEYRQGRGDAAGLGQGDGLQLCEARALSAR